MTVYLDMAATTPTDPRVAELVFRLMTEEFGNAGSRTHQFGIDALQVTNRARLQVAKAIGRDVSEVVFTSGATEANNIALLGLAAGQTGGKRHIVSTAIEHKAVLEPLQHLSANGFEVTLIQPDSAGYIDPDSICAAVRDDTFLVSVMHANNETGAIQSITEIANGLADEGAYFHVDAAQTFGKLNAALANPRIDLISISGHKIFAPKGIGALIAGRRRGIRPPLEPLMFGGGQERSLRPGTLPVPLIAGLGLAAELAVKECSSREKTCRSIRAKALAAIAPLRPHVHGDENKGVLPHVLSFAVPGVDSEAIMVAARDLVAISNGSACTSANYTPSHVLTAMALSSETVSGTVRLSWSHHTDSIDWQEIVHRIDDLGF